MQANEFEKQVGQKMDELSFRPSAPVWNNIEEQLRKKRERRRLLFWLPLFFLLLTGGGIWWMSNRGLVEENYTATNNTQNKETIYQQNRNEQQLPAEPKSNEENSNKIKPDPIDQNNTSVLNPDPKNNPIASHSVQLNHSKKRSLSDKPVGFEKAKGNKQGTINVVPAMAEHNSTGESSDVNTSKPDVSINPTNTISNDTSITKTAVENPTLKDSSIKKDSVQKQDIKKKDAKKWTAGLIVFGGTSGVNSGTTVQQTSFNLLPAANGPTLDLPVSKAQNKLGLSIGFFANKQLSERISFVTGLQYSLASNTIDIGSRQQRDTIISANYNAPVRVTQYYSKGIDGNDYINNYHFISLPVGLDIKLFSHTPVYLHAGFGVHQLLATNALVYSNQNQVYYQDKNAFNKTQFSSSLGINYRASLNGRKITVGPQVQYNWTQLQKDPSSSKHLFSVGLNARIELIKL